MYLPTVPLNKCKQTGNWTNFFLKKYSSSPIYVPLRMGSGKWAFLLYLHAVSCSRDCMCRTPPSRAREKMRETNADDQEILI